MATPEHISLHSLPDFAQNNLVEALRMAVRSVPVYDPELLYVECHVCGKPVLWEYGKTTELLQAADVDLSTLDERCMIVAEGCPLCCPQEHNGYTLAVVRIAGLTPEEAIYMSKPAGNA